jgi:AraC-like DNA-binding protein
MDENGFILHETVTFQSDIPYHLYINRESEDYPAHWHTPFEIIMPTEGHYTAICGNDTYHLDEQDILIICPGTVHTLFAPTAGSRIIFQPYSAIDPANQEIESIISLIAPATIITPVQNHFIHEKACQLMHDILREYLEHNPFCTLSIQSKFLEFLMLVGRFITTNIHSTYRSDGKQQEYITKFMWICRYIAEHCSEDLSLDEIAALAGYSKFHFSRLFKQFTNMTFYKYLNHKRITYASRLLADPDLSITAVAIRSGFSNVTAFIRMFKLFHQCTPTIFRQMYYHEP